MRVLRWFCQMLTKVGSLIAPSKRALMFFWFQKCTTARYFSKNPMFESFPGNLLKFGIKNILKYDCSMLQLLSITLLVQELCVLIKKNMSEGLLWYLSKVEFKYFEIQLLFCFRRSTVYFKKQVWESSMIFWNPIIFHVTPIVHLCFQKCMIARYVC